MESEQDLGESEQGVLDRDPIIAGERDFQSATKAIAVNHGDGRQRQTVETIEDAMTADEQCFDRCGIRDPAKCTDICPRDEATGFAGSNDQTFWSIVLDSRQGRIEFGQHIL